MAAKTGLLAYYTQQSVITDPGDYGRLLEELPRNIPGLCAAIQGLLIHTWKIRRDGIDLSPERRAEIEIRGMARLLARIQEVDDRPLTVVRPLEKLLVVDCRHFATLLCAILRYQGVPARARCGFAAYLESTHWQDHWVCEYWHAPRKRWVLVDADVLDYDVSRDRFFPATKAWQLCRAGHADPNQFGFAPEARGLWAVRADMVRDLAALNRCELLCIDAWGLIDEKEDGDLSTDDLALLDEVAALHQAGEQDLPRLRTLYEMDQRLRVPRTIRSWVYWAEGVKTVDLVREGVMP